MQRKIRHRKKHYTIMIASDSVKHPVKKYHLKIGVARVLLAAVFILCVMAVCEIVYTSITLSDTMARNKKQAEQILELKEEADALAQERDEYADKIDILSLTINKKVEEEMAAAAKEDEQHMPNGFPLSGSAQIKSDEGNGETKTDKVIFNVASGVNVIASGEGTVIAVDTDTEYGNVVKIDHGNGYVSIYKNSGSAMVKQGNEVLRGAVLFVIGESNTELGYQIEKDGVLIDPMEIIEING